jgi:hypothetical protein
MSFNFILTSDTTFQAVDKINENFSGISNYWSAGTGNNSIISINDTNNISSNDYSFVGGQNSNSNGFYSFAYGKNVSADGDYSFATGESGSSIGDFSFTSGLQTTAVGNYSFAVGNQTNASGNYSFASGYQTTASGNYSFASGYQTTAIGNYSFASGYQTTALGHNSFVYSKNSLIIGDRSAIIGGENITGTSNDTVYIPSLKINTVNTSPPSPTKVLSIDLNGDVITKDLSFPSSFFTWNEITNTNITLSADNGYVSKKTGGYDISNYNTFTMPAFNSSDFGKKIIVTNNEDTVTRIVFPTNVYFSYYDDSLVKVDDKYIELYAYEYLELKLFYYNNLGSVTEYSWFISNFITNLKGNNNCSSTLGDFFKERVKT